MESSRPFFSLLDDEPIACAEDDALGAGKAALGLAGLLIASRNATPLTLVVDAGWGSGKSSLMKILASELVKHQDVHTVWFNAWSSSRADTLEGIIKSVLMRIDRRFLRRALQQVVERRALLGVARSASIVAGSVLGVTGLVDQLWNRLSASPQSRNDMAESLRTLTTEWAERGPYSPKRMLVVFIDDLDRCPPDTVLAVCEAIRIYLDVPGLTFVIGYDRSALTDGGLLEDLSPAGAAFMEKIFQTNYRLPPPSEEGAIEFARGCARRSGLTAPLTIDLLHLIASHANRNPRRIKRIINGLVLETTLNPAWQDIDDSSVESMVRLILLQYLYPGFYRQLTEHAPERNLVREFLVYRKAMRSALGVDPKVADEDVDSLYIDHDIPPPSSSGNDDTEDILGKLEARLPSSFAALAYDRSFVSLAGHLWNDANSDLIQQVLSRPPARVTSPPKDGIDEDDERTLGTPMSTAPHTGKSLLWIDDNPPNNRVFAKHLQLSGVYVENARDQEEASRSLRSRKWDLIISDVTRHGDPEAGFTDLTKFLSGGQAHTPVIFYVGRVTPERRNRASTLGALGITSSPMELRKIVYKALELT
ncbi:P-loop NTPase fold protein [Nocardiopsis suaedae]|uniref:P-loop NTPase fold protein n=1 Tax=Nocardiopsis suaedae TaxID=3018444 RepID=A0ABT4TVB6_9ACTN|nr:P-loop NTPase fold protein [Nocardiopsis suaedae]MDA2808643.1 P-loop NTPase fold protein [Nocardiopsis suaedae]